MLFPDTYTYLFKQPTLTVPQYESLLWCLYPLPRYDVVFLNYYMRLYFTVQNVFEPRRRMVANSARGTFIVTQENPCTPFNLVLTCTRISNLRH